MKGFYIMLSVLFAGFCVYSYACLGLWAQNKLKENEKYTLEIINQDSVRIHSPSTHTTYKCRMDEIDEVLINDNL